MLDIRLLREQPELVKARLARRDAGLVAAVDAVLEIDSARRAAETGLQNLQAERNRLSKEIGKLRAQKQDSSALEADVKAKSAEMQELTEKSEQLGREQTDLLLTIPNLPQEDVAIGADASQNPELRTWGEKPVIAEPRDHVAIAEGLGLIDSDRATKISGSGFACYVGAGARLERALLSFLLDLHTREHGYTEVSPPFLIRRECMVGTGQLPKFEEDMYAVDGGGLFLAPTAEVPVTNLHREEILTPAQLPIKYAAYTPCFRREAGSAGRETRGLIRMHQFDKVELVKICTPENSRAELESLTADAERVLQLLGLHYRVIELCTGDMGFGSARTYDIEVWAPGQNAYLEVSSCTNFEDFQARRMNLRFKGEDGKNRFCHTLNGSGTALARLYVALLESGLQPDGSVVLPEVLHSYFGAGKIEKR
ncbi:MAG: serine--tRNA ligase [Terrimicrobiaceae bacterium]|nr:serine--tRNA ligase [Terrimicrobiaceae bacterium]